jgi:hypothetical protein
MATAKNEVIQMAYRNPDASMPLHVPVLVICNTPDEVLENNVRINSAKSLKWLKSFSANDSDAILVGGGASVEDCLDKIKELRESGGTVFAMNAASQWLIEQGIDVDYQCIIDAKEETSLLVDSEAKDHLIGSQVHPKTMDSVKNPTVWHLESGNIEKLFPEDRVKKGGYVLLGGGAAVGNSAMCAAYALGFRKLHIFGMDSCHKDGRSHVYPQDMNKFIPNVEVQWADRTFVCSVAMKAQAERFQITSELLKQMGCEIEVYGDGLLQTMYRSKLDDLTEQQKYQRMWQFDSYRDHSPGENIADFYLDKFKPDDLIIDFGCGTGRAGVKFNKAGLNVLLVDFADNCRDEEAINIPFLQWDLSKPCPATSKYGFCTDVMEHIPTEDVETVVKNIMNSSKEVFFQISTVNDEFGDAIGAELHLTVKSHEWWKELFISLGFDVEFDLDLEIASLFYVKEV